MTNLHDYVPKPGDPVKVEGVIIKLIVVGVNAPAKTALVASASDPAVAYSVPVVQADSAALTPLRLSTIDHSSQRVRITIPAMILNHIPKKSLLSAAPPVAFLRERGANLARVRRGQPRIRTAAS